MTRLLRFPEVVKLTGLSRSTIDRQVAAGKFPRPVYPTQCTTAWRSDELDAWIEALPREAQAA